ncbi:MAG: hypothetical protein A2383_00650 [Candidatus Pacebacteria bacterium RIFOXYB1_FULL_39_46]|nr:MAG: hypothetical protein A2182_00480 [Candidatus Pacebacteria bacterium RIFOXYA1_FULL_38_18]OGJ38096.1 MAG: hypothetical protein A2383_00650 [Candidatus Pacebacteria bacterium RIFOXYB1_FULL_39_46]OGJ39683.1 MAG: hypothetical protein A2411_02795 [Candidatus Pacebacteria bacterium RIFOXYC1_FULL_39_21]OGJ39848.1 MAG: hypothetical protein A2582_00415 [Candidatus Pacebacteria bacterium RIFOXYD1_FULL_39_27]
MISVLIATKERPDSLLVCLQSIVSNQFTQYEVIVIDQSNVVSALIKQYLKKHHRIHFYHLPNRGRERGKSYALQQGLMKAKGEIIAFTDDDCIVDKKWLKILWQGFAQNKCDGLFGQVLPYQPAQHADETCPCTMRFAKKEFVRQPRYHVSIGYGNNMAFRKQALDEIGSPKTWLGPGSIGSNAEDAELTLRALFAKKIILRYPKSIVYHNRWLNAQEMKEQQLSYTQGEAACYGYFSFLGSNFCKQILIRGIKANLQNLKRNLLSVFSFNKGKRTRNNVYWNFRSLLASARGLSVGFWFFLTESLK